MMTCATHSDNRAPDSDSILDAVCGAEARIATDPELLEALAIVAGTVEDLVYHA